MDEQDLEGRRAHVTGGARGIGRAIAGRLAAGGARVAISDMDEAGAIAAAEDIGGGAIGVRCDVRDTAQVQAAIDMTVEAFGGLDILVNNAGVEIGKLVLDTEEEEFKRLLDINVMGVFRCTKAAAQALSAGGGGNIVNIASVAGIGGVPLLGAYCASKGAVRRFTETCAVEMRPMGIRVNCVCPAFIDTEMVARLVDPVAELTGLAFDDLVEVKQGRLGTVEEVAEVAAFLASDEAAWTTGASYVLDGGLTGSLL
jgi:NAD(P)-dependent dehydrogenase (short-subunit alcohol dehydrogenase family)